MMCLSYRWPSNIVYIAYQCLLTHINQMHRQPCQLWAETHFIINLKRNCEQNSPARLHSMNARCGIWFWQCSVKTDKGWHFVNCWRRRQWCILGKLRVKDRSLNRECSVSKMSALVCSLVLKSRIHLSPLTFSSNQPDKAWKWQSSYVWYNFRSVLFEWCVMLCHNGISFSEWHIKYVRKWWKRRKTPSERKQTIRLHWQCLFGSFFFKLDYFKYAGY